MRYNTPWRLIRLSSSLVVILFWVISSISSSSAAIPFLPAGWSFWGLRGGTEDSKDTIYNDTQVDENLASDENEEEMESIWESAAYNSTDAANETTIQEFLVEDNESSSSYEDEITSMNATADGAEKLFRISKRSVALKRRQFLDRIALVSSSLLRKGEPTVESSRTQLEDPDGITPQSDLRLPGRHIHIVTTAALPWFTGTAVNPLLRAAYLHRLTQEINHCSNAQWVTLVIPWLELPEDQQELYGKVFESQQDQEDYIRNWLGEDAGMPDVACPETGLEILFYPSRYHSGLRSIFAMGDIMNIMEPQKMDVCILEEPEHCNWYRAPGDGWTQRFNYVVGVVHTNYKEYASSHYSGLWTAPALAMISSAMVRAYCHKVIKLSDALQTYAPEKEATSNVHGVRLNFLNEGRRRAEQADMRLEEHVPEDDAPVYFIGKLLWAKGLDIMLEMEDYYRQCTGRYFEIDIYGSGPDQKDIMRAFHGRRRKKDILETTVALEGGTTQLNTSEQESDDEQEEAMGEDSDMLTEATLLEESDSEEMVEAPADRRSSLGSLHVKAKNHLAMIKKSINAVELPKTFHELRRQPIPASFPGRVDHATLKEQYKVFVNPSVSEVLCTTTAEALAMGKFVIIPVHPSNTFFLRFPNCLAYRNKLEFVANLRWALTHEPEPLTPEQSRQFTWEAATDRLIESAAITWREADERERLGKTKLDERIAWFHNEIGKGVTGDMLRKFFGAGPASEQVRYQMQFESIVDAGEEEGEESEDEDDGLSRKFRRSSFAENIRATVGDLSSFIQ